VLPCRLHDRLETADVALQTMAWAREGGAQLPFLTCAPPLMPPRSMLSIPSAPAVKVRHGRLLRCHGLRAPRPKP
jgi:hypothetical protein